MTLPQTVHIRDMRDETRTVRTFVLDAEVPEADPGQFVMLWLPGVDGKPISIPHPAHGNRRPRGAIRRSG